MNTHEDPNAVFRKHPPESWELALRSARLITKPLERFLKIEAASGILLFVAAAIALVLANSPASNAFQSFWQIRLGVTLGELSFVRPLVWWVNDGLMAIFFFVIGLEIRRELHHGQLSSMKLASLPLAAAAGGFVVPIFVYLAVARHPAAASGWSVPMATDIAFALGILSLLGRRAPPALRVLLLALAVIDDLGAILIIAVVYSSGLSWVGAGAAVAGVLGVIGLQRLGVRSKLAYVFPSLLVWGGTYAAGLHPTIAGVVLGLITPVRAWLGPTGLRETLAEEVARLESDRERISAHDLVRRLKRIDVARRETMSPAESLIHAMHGVVAFGIMPIFALANAGVVFSGGAEHEAASVVTAGTALGLALGKPLGVVSVALLSVRLGWARLPEGVGTRHIVVLGLVAGVGFTMALFLSQLAFVDETLLAACKIGVLAGSGLAAVLALGAGFVWLSPNEDEHKVSADEVEGRIP